MGEAKQLIQDIKDIKEKSEKDAEEVELKHADTIEAFNRTTHHIKESATKNQESITTLGDAIKDIKPPTIIIPDEFTIANLKDIKTYENVNINRPKWLKELDNSQTLVRFFNALKSQGVKTVIDATRENPVPVQLVHEKQFYRAMANIASAGGAPTFIDSDGDVVQVVLDDDGRYGVTIWGEYDRYAQDASTEAMTCIDYVHHEVHEGNAFVYNEVDESMLDDAVVMIVFRTPATGKKIHFFWDVNWKAAGHIQLFEGPTWTQGSGTQRPIFNRNRASGNNSVILEDTTGAFLPTMNVISKPALFAGGTVIRAEYVFSDKKIGGQSRDDNEMILAPDTQYGFICTADAGTNAVNILLSWYEHTDKN